MPLAKFRLSLLTTRLELSGPGGPVVLPTRKCACLLVYLACTFPALQRRETLTALLWGSHADLQARRSLRQALFQLRRTLGQDVLIAAGEQISLAPGAVECDAAWFETLIRNGRRASLVEAVNLYKHPFLADLAIAEEGWADWVTSERQRLEELALDAMVKLGEMELNLGHANPALHAARRALAINNLREDAHRLVLKAMAAAGRRAEALKHYESVAALFERELHAEPDAATKSLVAELRDVRPPGGSTTTMEAAVAEPDAGGNREMSVTPILPGEAERRQLTIMACRVTRPFPASTRLDPEDMYASIITFHKMVADVVARFNGFVARYLGDGVRVYFGYPSAHERDPEQAIRAGLAIREALEKLEAGSGISVQARIGIATGLVVIGDSLETDATRQILATGAVPSRAVQMLSAAPPGQIAIDAGTRRLVERVFECCALPASTTNAPEEAWQVYGEVQGTARTSWLVGRQEEIDLLLRRWEQARAGQGRVALLSGELGIGKSRLATALSDRVASEPHVSLRYVCSPRGADSAFFPIISQMERAAGLAHDDAPQAKRDKLDALLARTSTSIEDAALFAEMLAIPNDGRYPLLEFTPQRRRERMLEAHISWIEALSRQSPVLMIVEDAHWIDPTTREALDRFLDRIPALRVLLIITFRPEFDAPWIGHPRVTLVAVNRLAPREVGIIIDQVAGDRPLPASLRRDIIVRADGIPLFVEEMTKSVLEAEGPDASEVVAGPPVISLPASLYAPLTARLDRLGTAKETAQIGAAIGREFSHALLAAVTRKPEEELKSALDRLVAAGLLFRRGVAPQATYLFKHVLVQDVAYATLLRRQRRALHARIAETLESQFTDVVEGRPELLAHHCAEAGQAEKAARLWERAGQRSLERSALAEAAEQFTRALGQIETLTATPALRRAQIKLQVALLTPLIHINGFAAAETKAAAERARLLIEQAEALGEPPEDSLLLFSVLYGFWAANCLAFNGDAVRGLAEQFLSLAEKRGAAVPLMVGHRLMGVSLMCTGDLAESRAHYDRALALYDPLEHRAIATRFGNDTEVVVLGFRSWAQWLLGYPEAALRDADGALEKARDMGRTPTLMFALWLVTIPHLLSGDCSVATARLQEDLALAEEKGAAPWKAVVIAFKGCVLALTGEAAEAIGMIRSGIAAWRSTGSTVGVPLYLSYLAGAEIQLGQFDDAWRCIAEATAMMEATKETWFEAEVHRMAGEIALKSPRADEAKAGAYFERAITVARRQQAKSLELRGAISMARLWRDQGSGQRARDLLAQVYGWYTEGFDTPDLMEAKALLDSLAD